MSGRVRGVDIYLNARRVPTLRIEDDPERDTGIADWSLKLFGPGFLQLSVAFIQKNGKASFFKSDSMHNPCVQYCHDLIS
jgi:hypothetical protein